MAGDVWDLVLDPKVGHEQGGYRPALVISNDYFNRTPNGLHIVVPITGTDRDIRYHVRLAPPEGGLTKPSVVMCDQARAVSVERFRRRRGAVSLDLLRRVQLMVGEFIDR
ncbi:MAG TPA: type II toxin-antitoxin system PemK/MazF family toxin [Thermomicrobiales bacterium]|nr:type II toxin-antitoxin system PemK/MazF family toxin [Thermomicrobiales bacterium]